MRNPALNENQIDGETKKENFGNERLKQRTKKRTVPCLPEPTPCQNQHRIPRDSELSIGEALIMKLYRHLHFSSYSM